MSEMPINKFQLAGDWGPKAPKRGWDKPSIGILTNPKGVQKIKNMWANTDIDFDMYFVRQAGAMQHLEVGEVDPAWVQENLGMELEPNPAGITILFTQNRGDEKVPMTGWTIGHRLGHALSRRSRGGITGKFFEEMTNMLRKELSELFEMAYGSPIKTLQPWMRSDQDIQQIAKSEQKLKYIAQALGSMKSAREGNLRNYGEFAFELFGQYVLQGAVKFRMPPAQLGKRSHWGNVSYQYHNRMKRDFEQVEIQHKLEVMEDIINQECERILHSAVGKIFVM